MVGRPALPAWRGLFPRRSRGGTALPAAGSAPLVGLWPGPSAAAACLDLVPRRVYLAFGTSLFLAVGVPPSSFGGVRAVLRGPSGLGLRRVLLLGNSFDRHVYCRLRLGELSWFACFAVRLDRPNLSPLLFGSLALGFFTALSLLAGRLALTGACVPRFLMPAWPR